MQTNYPTAGDQLPPPPQNQAGKPPIHLSSSKPHEDEVLELFALFPNKPFTIKEMLANFGEVTTGRDHKMIRHPRFDTIAAGMGTIASSMSIDSFVSPAPGQLYKVDRAGEYAFREDQPPDDEIILSVRKRGRYATVSRAFDHRSYSPEADRAFFLRNPDQLSGWLRKRMGLRIGHLEPPKEPELEPELEIVFPDALPVKPILTGTGSVVPFDNMVVAGHRIVAVLASGDLVVEVEDKGAIIFTRGA